MNIVITGASRGIGKAIAEKFAAENHQVIICSRDENKLKEIHQEFPSVITYPCDMSSKTEILQFGDFVLQTFDKIDILVNNAGVFLPGKITEEVEENRFRMDLYHRLSVILIHVPSLNERKDDIPVLTEHFLNEICGDY